MRGSYRRAMFEDRGEMGAGDVSACTVFPASLPGAHPDAELFVVVVPGSSRLRFVPGARSGAAVSAGVEDGVLDHGSGLRREVDGAWRARWRGNAVANSARICTGFRSLREVYGAGRSRSVPRDRIAAFFQPTLLRKDGGRLARNLGDFIGRGYLRDRQKARSRRKTRDFARVKAGACRPFGRGFRAGNSGEWSRQSHRSRKKLGARDETGRFV